MGCFDTFIFQGPLYCPICGAIHLDIQSKSHGSQMYTYRIGDKVRGAERYEIAELEYYCTCASVPTNNCDDLKEKLFGSKYFASTVYILIEDYRFKGVSPTRGLAERIGNLPDDVEDYYFNSYNG